MLCALFTLMAGVPMDCARAAPAHASVPLPAPSHAPDAIAVEFYGWYLETLCADQDPLSDRYERFTGYVTQDLTRRLVERLRQKPLPQADYFLQTPAWQPAWRSGVRAALLRRERNAAEVLVTLSGNDVPTRTLLLALVLENGAWKIRGVRPAEPAVESSAEQPVI